ncbi:hypothetical protein D3C80_2111180 [compost metagenome]
MRILGGPYQLVDFQMQNIVVTVLSILNQKHHQERNDGCRRVDDELPGVVVIEIWPRQPPHDD